MDIKGQYPHYSLFSTEMVHRRLWDIKKIEKSDNEIIYDGKDTELQGEEARTGSRGASHLEMDGQKMEQSFAKLVLTPVELIRRLMEKQALRRTEKQFTDRRADSRARHCLYEAGGLNAGA